MAQHVREYPRFRLKMRPKSRAIVTDLPTRTFASLLSLLHLHDMEWLPDLTVLG